MRRFGGASFLRFGAHVVPVDNVTKRTKITQLSDNVLAAIDAQKEFGSITDERARNAVALYSALLGMNQRAGTDGTEAVRNAGYVMYAYLGGQARRDITYTREMEG